MSEKLIFEKSVSGRKGYTLPSLDVESKDIKELLPQDSIRQKPAALPEISEPEVMRHFTQNFFRGPIICNVNFLINLHRIT